MIERIPGTITAYNPVQDHIGIRFKVCGKDEERLKEIAQYWKNGAFDTKKSRALVFFNSRRKAEECTVLMPECLKEVYQGSCSYADQIGFFHAGMDAEDRREIYEKFKSGELSVLFATKAFGMGMDIPNVHFVAHYSPPASFEDFLQEIGRAGRNAAGRKIAGFVDGKQIESLCLLTAQDFGKLKDRAQSSRVSWSDVKNSFQLIEDYQKKFQASQASQPVAIPVPFDLYSTAEAKLEGELDQKFRMALYWLEQLGRIRLGYFTATYLSFSTAPFSTLAEQIPHIRKPEVRRVCEALLDTYQRRTGQAELLPVSLIELQTASGLSSANIFRTLFEAHANNYIVLKQEFTAVPTNIRKDEIDHFVEKGISWDGYPALKIIFSMARTLMSRVPNLSQKVFDGEEVEQILQEALEDLSQFSRLPWAGEQNEADAKKALSAYLRDIKVKRAKHAFTILRLLKKVKYQSLIQKNEQGLTDRKVKVCQSLYNGYQHDEDWQDTLEQWHSDCSKLLQEISKQNHQHNIRRFNLADLMNQLELDGSVAYLSDLLFMLSCLGYLRYSGLTPTGIEVTLLSLDEISETNSQSPDKGVYDQYLLTGKIKELKLIALQVLSSIATDQQDTYIRKFFSCNSYDQLLHLLEEYLGKDHSAFKAFRQEAMLIEEERLSAQQKAVYDHPITDHICVMAGPGSGKTHTLALRVARLIHHEQVPPEEILVLAYNRAVVAELKHRLLRLFKNLGYETLSKRVQVYTFHGLAKKYCRTAIEGKEFGEWERILLDRLRRAPGMMMSEIGQLKHILVDEFQDITGTRLDLLEKLHQLTEARVFIIGDPNQSIYGYERVNDHGQMSPWYYYEQFFERFQPQQFELTVNYRSFPDVLTASRSQLQLPERYQYLFPQPFQQPDEDFQKDYVEIYDTTQTRVNWWEKITGLLTERIKGANYRQIGILFRTNNEVYKAYQRLQTLGLHGVRIRIQGSLPYEFLRIRECFQAISFFRQRKEKPVSPELLAEFKHHKESLLANFPYWNAFYLHVIHALCLEFLEEKDEQASAAQLVEFIEELTQRDDGQLYKLFEKHALRISPQGLGTEIILTTMHKVKGLEYDVVIIPPSFADLPMKDQPYSPQILQDHIEEEKRLMFVAYTRAKYRLLVFKNQRELHLDQSLRHRWPETVTSRLGYPVKPELKKLFISWSAQQFNYAINLYIEHHVKSGDEVNISNQFVIHQGNKIGKLAGNAFGANVPTELSGLIINEVVTWTYEETKRNAEAGLGNFLNHWCDSAQKQGYIYLVDFAGYGTETL
jgi:superfamily I DNA/RNA helicase